MILALTHLHEKNIAHRGISSENIGLDCHGFVKVKGFQHVKIIEKGQRSFTLCGSPEYMSPEMITYRGHTTATDLWSLGIVTFELLYGYFPKGSFANKLKYFHNAADNFEHGCSYFHSVAQTVHPKLMNVSGFAYPHPPDLVNI